MTMIMIMIMTTTLGGERNVVILLNPVQATQNTAPTVDTSPTSIPTQPPTSNGHTTTITIC